MTYEDAPDARKHAEPRFSEREVADYFGVSLLTLRRWRREGRISYLRHGRRVVFTQRDLDEYEARSRVAAQQPDEVDPVWRGPRRANQGGQ